MIHMMGLWDTVTYNEHPCVVEQEWEDPNTHHHMLALRPRDIAGGLFLVDEDDLNASTRNRDDRHAEPPVAPGRESV